jgi:hypothetical protein
MLGGECAGVFGSQVRPLGLPPPPKVVHLSAHATDYEQIAAVGETTSLHVCHQNCTGVVRAVSGSWRDRETAPPNDM